MARPARVVEHLRLRGESESAVRHALPALQDGFRTASLPDAGARLVCVRRLQLGRLPSNGSSQNVALLIERRFAEAGWKIVHANENGAEAAEAVWFRDTFEAHETAALKVAAGQTLDAWYWPLVLPRVVKVADGETLRTIAFAIASMEEAPRALPAWTASLVRAGYRQQLIAALRPGDGHALLGAAGVTFLSSEYARATAVTSHQARDRPVSRETVDDRNTFVDVVASRAGGHLPHLSPAIAERPATRARRSADGIAAAPETPAPQLDASPDGVSDQGRERKQPGHRLIQRERAKGETARNESTDVVVPKAFQDRREEPETISSPNVPSGQPAAVVAAGALAEPAGESDRAAGSPLAFTSPWQLPYAAPTTAGGLLFLLPVLERVGFADWAAGRGPEEPEPDVLTAQILHLLLSRLQTDEGDPVWRLAAGFRLQPEDIVAAATWLTICRRYLRRRVRIGLASLVVRRARVDITPTHVDVFFRLNAADVRVRRAGLDIDPGWVPWFGRVVTFHYEDRPWN